MRTYAVFALLCKLAAAQLVVPYVFPPSGVIFEDWHDDIASTAAPLASSTPISSVSVSVSSSTPTLVSKPSPIPVVPDQDEIGIMRPDLPGTKALKAPRAPEVHATTEVHIAHGVHKPHKSPKSLKSLKFKKGPKLKLKLDKLPKFKLDKFHKHHEHHERQEPRKPSLAEAIKIISEAQEKSNVKRTPASADVSSANRKPKRLRVYHPGYGLSSPWDRTHHYPPARADRSRKRSSAVDSPYEPWMPENWKEYDVYKGGHGSPDTDKRKFGSSDINQPQIPHIPGILRRRLRGRRGEKGDKR